MIICRSNSLFTILLALSLIANPILLFSQNLAQPTLTIDTGKTYELNDFYYLLEEGKNELTIEQVTSSSYENTFKPIESFSPLKEGVIYWGRIILQNNLATHEAKANWLFKPKDGVVTELQLYYRDELSNKFIKRTVGEYVPNSISNGIYQFAGRTEHTIPIALSPQKPLVLFVRMKNEFSGRIPSFKSQLTFPTIAEQNNSLRLYFIGGLFLGAISIMCIYIGVLAFYLKDKTYLYYALYLFFIAVLVAETLGVISDWVFNSLLVDTSPKYRFIFMVFRSPLIIFYLLFIKSYADLKTILPTWNKVLNFLIKFGVVWMVLDLITLIISDFTPFYSNYFFLFYLLMTAPSTTIMLYPLYKKKIKANQYIIIGSLMVVLGGLAMVPILLGGLVKDFISVVLFAILAEVVIFSIGLSYRQRNKEREIQKSQAAQLEVENLKKFDTIKNNFYTNITHEFRTPLTVIMGMNDNIKGHQKEKRLIRRNSKNLLQLVNQLLDLSKLESVGTKLNKKQGDIVYYLQYLGESFSSMATDKGIQLTFYSEEEELLMDYDEVKIQHIIYNLLSNALKFTSEGGKVIMHLQKIIQEDKPFLKLIVRDTGIGIPKDQIAHIFDRFYQIDHAKNNRANGTGIGLALVKDLVQLMEGKVEVKSQENKGTTFTIYLPIETKFPLDRELLTDTKSKATSIAINNPATTMKEGLELDLPILLIIEDNKDIVAYIQSLLDKQYTIYVAKNGQAGIEKAIHLVPDIIISDVMMPIKNGYEVCEVLKQEEQTSHIPIILLTAKSTQKDKIDGLKYGADAFLTKPFYKEELLVRIEQLVAIRKKLQQRYATNIIATTIDQPIENIFLEKVLRSIEENLDETTFGVPELAATLAMSKSQLYRKLKALTNKTPSHYIRISRLTKGKELLQNTNLNISEIAYNVGFTDPNYFSRAFQQEFRKSPRDFRNSL